MEGPSEVWGIFSSQGLWTELFSIFYWQVSVRAEGRTLPSHIPSLLSVFPLSLLSVPSSHFFSLPLFPSLSFLSQHSLLVSLPLLCPRCLIWLPFGLSRSRLSAAVFWKLLWLLPHSQCLRSEKTVFTNRCDFPNVLYLQQQTGTEQCLQTMHE